MNYKERSWWYLQDRSHFISFSAHDAIILIAITIHTESRREHAPVTCRGLLLKPSWSPWGGLYNPCIEGECRHKFAMTNFLWIACARQRKVISSTLKPSWKIGFLRRLLVVMVPIAIVLLIRGISSPKHEIWCVPCLTNSRDSESYLHCARVHGWSDAQFAATNSEVAEISHGDSDLFWVQWPQRDERPAKCSPVTAVVICRVVMTELLWLR